MVVAAIQEAVVAAIEAVATSEEVAAEDGNAGDAPGTAGGHATTAHRWASRVKQLCKTADATRALNGLGQTAGDMAQVAGAVLTHLEGIQKAEAAPLPFAPAQPATLPATPSGGVSGAIFVRSDAKPGHLEMLTATPAILEQAARCGERPRVALPPPAPPSASSTNPNAINGSAEHSPLVTAAFDLLTKADDCVGVSPRHALDGTPFAPIAPSSSAAGQATDTSPGGNDGVVGPDGNGGGAPPVRPRMGLWPLWSAHGIPFGVIASDAPPALVAPLADAAAAALEQTWRRELLRGVLDGLGEWVSILSAGPGGQSMEGAARHVPSMDAPKVVGEVHRLPLGSHGAVAITLGPRVGNNGATGSTPAVAPLDTTTGSDATGDGGDATGGGGSTQGGTASSEAAAPPVAMSENLRRGLEATAPLLKPLMRELDLLVIGQPVRLSESFGLHGSRMSLTVGATLPKARRLAAVAEEEEEDADRGDEGGEDSEEVGSTGGMAAAATAPSAAPTSAADSRLGDSSAAEPPAAGPPAAAAPAAAPVAPARAGKRSSAPAADPMATAVAGRSQPRRTRLQLRRETRRGGVVIPKYRPWRPRRRAAYGPSVTPHQAVRLLLPRKLQADVGAKLADLDLKAALAELKSYREPPVAVRQVVVAVLCLLGKGTLAMLGTWALCRPHLKPSLRRALLEFDATQEGGEGQWKESEQASAGLTSDEVHKKGSVAVQAMLRWLEVARLTKREAGAVAATLE